MTDDNEERAAEAKRAEEEGLKYPEIARSYSVAAEVVESGYLSIGGLLIEKYVRDRVAEHVQKLKRVAKNAPIVGRKDGPVG